jgi:hypothetical protein
MRIEIGALEPKLPWICLRTELATDSTNPPSFFSFYDFILLLSIGEKNGCKHPSSASRSDDGGTSSVVSPLEGIVFRTRDACRGSFGGAMFHLLHRCWWVSSAWCCGVSTMDRLVALFGVMVAVNGKSNEVYAIFWLEDGLVDRRRWLLHRASQRCSLRVCCTGCALPFHLEGGIGYAIVPGI